MRRTELDLSAIRCNVVDGESTGRRRAESALFHVGRHVCLTHCLTHSNNEGTVIQELNAFTAGGPSPRLGPASQKPAVRTNPMLEVRHA